LPIVPARQKKVSKDQALRLLRTRHNENYLQLDPHRALACQAVLGTSRSLCQTPSLLHVCSKKWFLLDFLSAVHGYVATCSESLSTDNEVVFFTCPASVKAASADLAEPHAGFEGTRTFSSTTQVAATFLVVQQNEPIFLLLCLRKEREKGEGG